MLLSVVVPTFNEGDSVAELIGRLDKSLLGISSEVIIVDDGSDHLPDIVKATPSTVPVRVIRRKEPTGRLGGAVVEGFRQARGDLLVCLDGDLQHPPELIPEMVEAAHHTDMVVASRYTQGGDAGGLSSGFRKMVSRGSGFLTKISFPLRLRKCTDPMSGFFLVRRSHVDLDTLKPKGFKILLEIISRSQSMRISEVPLVFGERTAGESHATMKEGFRFLQQLLLLRLDNKLVRFTAVGISGVLPNLLTVWVLMSMGVHYLLATFFGIQVAVLWNYIGAEFFVWKDHRFGHWLRRFGPFVLVAELDLVRLPFLVLLVRAFGGHVVTATLITLLGAFLLRFTLADRLVYKPRKSEVVVSVSHLTPMEEST